MSIRVCFEMFVDHLRKSNKEIPQYENLSVKEMKDTINVLYMQYLLMNSFTVSNNFAIMAYHHLMSMMKEESINESISVSNETPMIISEVKTETKRMDLFKKMICYYNIRWIGLQTRYFIMCMSMEYII